MLYEVSLGSRFINVFFREYVIEYTTLMTVQIMVSAVEEEQIPKNIYFLDLKVFEKKLLV